MDIIRKDKNQIFFNENNEHIPGNTLERGSYSSEEEEDPEPIIEYLPPAITVEAVVSILSK
jgi:hypothetical protein